MDGQYQCKFLVLGKVANCSRICATDYCAIHKRLLKRGGKTSPCSKCGKGVKTPIGVCMDCGFHVEKARWVYAKVKAFRAEWRRLSSILIEDVEKNDTQLEKRSD